MSVSKKFVRPKFAALVLNSKLLERPSSGARRASQCLEQRDGRRDGRRFLDCRIRVAVAAYAVRSIVERNIDGGFGSVVSDRCWRLKRLFELRAAVDIVSANDPGADERPQRIVCIDSRRESSAAFLLTGFEELPIGP